jgi:hypothetical protein
LIPFNYISQTIKTMSMSIPPFAHHLDNDQKVLANPRFHQDLRAIQLHPTL